MNDRMRKGCCRLLALLLTLVLVIPAYGQETLDALAAAQGCTAETLLQSDTLTAGDSVSDWVAIAVSRAGTEGDTSAYRKALERYVTRMYREQGGLDRLRATEWQRTALTALALLLCVIGVGVYLTVTMLFKINTLEVAVDGEVVQEVGGYSSAEILQALGVHAEENIFSFDPAEKAAALEKQFPLLENIRVERDYPNTVVVRTNAATAVYAMQTSSGWLSLSAGLKILDKDSAQPDLIILCGGEPVSTTPGTQLEFETGPSGPSSGSAASDSAASSEAGPPTDKRLESLNTLLTALDSSELGADVTRIEFEDPEQMAFLYQGRISVLLGTLNELDYKLRLAKYVLLNEDGKGCSPTDTGMLDLSHLSASSSRKFRFAQGEPTLPSGWTAPEEPAAPAEAEAESQPEEASGTEPDTEGAEAAPAEDPTAAAAEQQ